MRELATRETDDEYARLWRLDDDDRTLFVTHLTPESATRYQFDVTNPEEKRCVYVKGDGTTPPRVVVELLNDEGFTATNLPNITEDDPAKKAMQIVEAIDWLSKHGGLEPGDLRQFAYQRAHNVMPTIYASVLLVEVLGPDRFTEHLDDVLADAARNGVDITREELRDPRTHNIEFLQHTLIELRRSLPMDEQKQVAELAEERLGIDVHEEEKESGTSWDMETHSEATFQLNPEAVATLKDEGWLPDDW